MRSSARRSRSGCRARGSGGTWAWSPPTRRRDRRWSSSSGPDGAGSRLQQATPVSRGLKLRYS